jgi:hypothetical protein
MAHLSGLHGYAYPTSVVTGSSALLYPLGTRARDMDGNEYMYVDFQTAAAEGEVLAISAAYLADNIATATVGRVGIVCATTTSDSYGWVQIYGTAVVQLATTDAAVGAVGLSTGTTDAVSMIQAYTTDTYPVNGMYITALITNSSAFSSVAGSTIAPSTVFEGFVTVELNYPFVTAIPSQGSSVAV